ncbi:MAG: HAD family phosphatase [Oscillospiraceae bacterium]|nr:HAD family phosphatase [Oscillospiraceae bacterium]
MIFDMDGTLLDSMGMWRSLDSEFLRAHGIEPPPDISDIVKTMTVEEGSAYYAERFGLGISPQQVSDEIEAMAAEAYRERLLLKPCAREFLLSARKRGIPCAVASATYSKLLAAALERLRIRQEFLCVLTPQEGYAGKDTPELYFAAAERIGAKPEEIIVFEDALHAAETAKKAGFYVIGIADALYADTWQEMQAVCDRTICGWEEICTDAFFAEIGAEPYYSGTESNHHEKTVSGNR